MNTIHKEKPKYFEALTGEAPKDCKHDQEGPGVHQILPQVGTPYYLCIDQVADLKALSSNLVRTKATLGETFKNCSKCGLVQKN
jgi:hypothetical protein